MYQFHEANADIMHLSNKYNIGQTLFVTLPPGQTYIRCVSPCALVGWPSPATLCYRAAWQGMKRYFFALLEISSAIKTRVF